MSQSVCLGDGFKLVFDDDVEPFKRNLIDAFTEKLTRCMKLQIGKNISPSGFYPRVPEDMDLDFWWPYALFETAQMFQHLVTKYEFEYVALSGMNKRDNPPKRGDDKKFTWKPLIEEQAEKIIQSFLRDNQNRTHPFAVSIIRRKIIRFYKLNPHRHPDSNKVYKTPSVSNVDSLVSAYIKRKYPHLHKTFKSN